MVNTSQSTPTVFYAHGSCRTDLKKPSGSMLYRQRKVLLREWRTPAFRSWTPSTHTRLILPLSIAIFALDLSVRSARAEACSTQDSYI